MEKFRRFFKKEVFKILSLSISLLYNHASPVSLFVCLSVLRNPSGFQGPLADFEQPGCNQMDLGEPRQLLGNLVDFWVGGNQNFGVLRDTLGVHIGSS